MIQVATYSGKEAKYNGELVEQYSLHDICSLDEYDITVIDLNSEYLWKNRESDTQTINRIADFKSISEMIKNSLSSQIVFVLPQNVTFEYYNWNGKNYSKSRELKDMLNDLTKYILPNLYQPITEGGREMIAIAVDDEPLMLGALVKAIKASPDIAAVMNFTVCEEALDFIKSNPADIAFLDINMRGMGGLSLAEKIINFCPDCKIVFCTGYEEYAITAFKLHASGYLMKPISAKDVQVEIDNIKGIRQKQKPLTVKCFGNFEVFAKGEKLTFKRSKTKELLAFLVDRNGAGVTVAEIGVALWGSDEEQKNQNYIHQLFRDLRQALEAVGVDDFFERNNYFYSINPEKIDCDYYTCLKIGKPEFRGEYMSQYSWAEETCGLLWEKKNK